MLSIGAAFFQIQIVFCYEKGERMEKTLSTNIKQESFLLEDVFMLFHQKFCVLEGSSNARKQPTDDGSLMSFSRNKMGQPLEPCGAPLHET